MHPYQTPSFTSGELYRPKPARVVSNTQPQDQSLNSLNQQELQPSLWSRLPAFQSQPSILQSENITFQTNQHGTFQQHRLSSLQSQSNWSRFVWEQPPTFQAETPTVQPETSTLQNQAGTLQNQTSSLQNQPGTSRLEQFPPGTFQDPLLAIQMPTFHINGVWVGSWAHPSTFLPQSSTLQGQSSTFQSQPSLSQSLISLFPSQSLTFQPQASTSQLQASTSQTPSSTFQQQQRAFDSPLNANQLGTSRGTAEHSQQQQVDRSSAEQYFHNVYLMNQRALSLLENLSSQAFLNIFQSFVSLPTFQPQNASFQNNNSSSQPQNPSFQPQPSQQPDRALTFQDQNVASTSLSSERMFQASAYWVRPIPPFRGSASPFQVSNGLVQNGPRQPGHFVESPQALNPSNQSRGPNLDRSSSPFQSSTLSSFSIETRSSFQNIDLLPDNDIDAPDFDFNDLYDDMDEMLADLDETFASLDRPFPGPKITQNNIEGSFQIDEEKDCAICFDNVDGPMKCLDCNQIAGCKECVTKWYEGQKNASCPLCRQTSGYIVN